GTHDRQDIGRSDGSVRQGHAGTNKVVLLHKNLFRQRNEVFLYLTRFGCNGDLLVSTFDFSKRYLTINFRYNCRVGRVARLKQFGNARKTSGDVARFADGTRNLHQYVAHPDLVVFILYDVGTKW